MTVHTFDIVLDSIRGFNSVVSRSLIVKPMKSAIYICPILQTQIILDSCGFLQISKHISQQKKYRWLTAVLIEKQFRDLLFRLLIQQFIVRFGLVSEAKSVLKCAAKKGIQKLIAQY
jgi:hypothetical protein